LGGVHIAWKKVLNLQRLQENTALTKTRALLNAASGEEKKKRQKETVTI